MSTKTITNIETVSRDFGDYPDQKEHRAFCTFVESGRRKVAMLYWRDKHLERPRAPEYTDHGLDILIGPEDPEKPNRMFDWLDDVSVEDTIACEPFFDVPPSAAPAVLEDALPNGA